MNDRETVRYEMFGRVETFGNDNAADFAPTSEATKRFTNIRRIIGDLDREKSKQQGGDATAKEVLADALRLDIQNIARTARAIDQDEPGFAAKFRLPDSSSQAALLTTADSFLRQLVVQPGDNATTQATKTAVAAKFVAHEFSADFVSRLQSDRTAIDTAEDTIESGDQESVASTAAVGRLIREGMKEVNYLNAIMHNKYSRDAEKLRAWKSASHIERTERPTKKAASAKTPATQ
jgi:hypothetical protein